MPENLRDQAPRIDEETYQNFLKFQDFRCAICRVPSIYRKMTIDHDHQNGQMRGLLCGQCNSGLGFFCDSIELLAMAIAYLSWNRERMPQFLELLSTLPPTTTFYSSGEEERELGEEKKGTG